MERIGTQALVRAVAAEIGLPEAKVQLVLRAVLWRLMDELADGHRVTLTGFGSFAPRIVAPRRVHDPASGAVREIDARGKVQFSAGKQLRDIAEGALTALLSRRVSEDGDALIVLVADEDEDAAGADEGELPDVQANGSTARNV